MSPGLLFFSACAILSVACCCICSTYCMRKLLWLWLWKALIYEYTGRTWKTLLYNYSGGDGIALLLYQNITSWFLPVSYSLFSTVLQRYNNTNRNGIDINTYVDQNNWIRDTDISPHTYRLMFIFLTKKLENTIEKNVVASSNGVGQTGWLNTEEWKYI